MSRRERGAQPPVAPPILDPLVSTESAPSITEPVEQDLLLRGVRVRYLEAGRGPALLLVHSVFTSASTWAPIIPFLAPRFRVIAPDLPGFGASEKPTAFPFTHSAFAETLCDLLAGVDAPRAHVVGHALGGAVALTLAADHPEFVDRLAVLNTPPARGPIALQNRLALTPVLGSIFLKQFYNRPAFHAYFRDSLYAEPSGYDRARVDGWYDAFDSPEARECALRTLRNASDLAALGPRIAKVRAPTMVIWGERDRQGPTHLGRRLTNEVIGARFEPIARAGHCPHEELPEPTADALLRHLIGGPRRS